MLKTPKFSACTLRVGIATSGSIKDIRIFWLKHHFLMSLSVILEAIVVVALSSFFIILTTSFFKFRLARKREELNLLTQRLAIEDISANIKLHLDKEYSKKDYMLPVAFVTILSFIGLFLLLLSPILYDVEPGQVVKSPFWSGSGFWDDNTYGTEKRSLAIVAWTLLGGYINGAQYIYRRFSTVDLTPGNFYSVGIRMVLATVVSTILANFIKVENGMPEHMILAVAFLSGMFPERGFKLLVKKVSAVFPTGDKDEADNLPLQAIEGISYLHQLRLREVGIDNVQNLANFDLLMLSIKTPFPPRLLIDWVAQAKLLIEFHHDTTALQKAGIRSALDYLDAFEDTDISMEELSRVTGLEPILLEINYKNMANDRSLKLLGQFKESLFHIRSQR